MRNVDQFKMFAFAHFSYDKEQKTIILRVITVDETELYFTYPKDKEKTLQYFNSDTRILIDASVPEEMRRVCEER